MNKFSVTEFEMQILQLLWQKGVLSVREVWQTLFPDGERAYTTVQTVMDRMTRKKLLEKEKIGMVNFYRARISEENLKRQVTEKFVKSTFNGSFGSLAAFLLTQGDFDQKELEEIRKLINQKEGELNDEANKSH